MEPADPQADDFRVEYPYIAKFDVADSGDLDILLRDHNVAVSDPVTSPVDLALERICRAYLNGTAAGREGFRSCVANRSSLLLFAERAAVRAMRTSGTEHLRLGLAALSMEDCRYDFRETSRLLVMLLHAADSIGADWRLEFDAVAGLSSPRTADFFRAYGSRGPSAYEPLEWFFLRITDGNGPTFLSLSLSESEQLVDAKRRSSARE
jgi:hypothetical protein